MASPLGRLIAQILVVGSGIVSKAFMQAYEQAIANARRPGGTKAAVASLSQALSTKIKPEEARLILNVKSDASKEEIEKAYKALFEANDTKNGGSLYLQSKVFRAHECLSRLVDDATSAEAPRNDDKPI